MRLNRICIHQPLSNHQTVILDEGKSHYLQKVLRLKIGHQLILFNGNGREYLSEITELQKKSLQLRTLSESDPEAEPALTIHLGLALSKGDRFDIAIQKATELGVSRITPLITEFNTLKLPADRLEKKVVHWQGIIEAACEQSERNYLPLLDSPCNLQDWQDYTLDSNKLVLHPDSEQTFATLKPNQKLTLLVGPEGGLSEQDLQLANSKGFIRVKLGQHILRTETAPLAAIAAAQVLWGAFR